MTTREFIKILQEADPSGTSHIRMEGGIPLFAELKPGYWDGPYSYIDEEGNYVTSTEGSKVDIHCLDIWYFVERYENLSWDEIREKFKFNYTYSSEEQKREREDQIIKIAKEAYDTIKEVREESYQRSLTDMIKNAGSGWKWFQSKDPELKPIWKIFKGDGTLLRGSSPHLTEPILKSGLWKRIDDSEIEGYYEWVYKIK